MSRTVYIKIDTEYNEQLILNLVGLVTRHPYSYHKNHMWDIDDAKFRSMDITCSDLDYESIRRAFGEQVVGILV